LTEAGRQRSRYIQPHTLLLTNSGATLGVPKISLVGGCINDGVAALLNVDYPLKKYLLIYLRSKTLDMRRVNQGAAQPNLNTTIIKRYRVPVPPTDEQHRIVAEVDRRLSIMREVETQVDLSLRRAQALRQGVLASKFAGVQG
jgi:type I restriction enzyme S subunit